MLLFFSIILLIFIIVIIIMSDLKITIEKLELKQNNKKFDFKFYGKINIVFLNKIKLFEAKVDSTKLSRKSRIVNEITKLNNTKNSRTNKGIICILKEIKKYIVIELFNLVIDIDTESVMLTSYLVGTIYTIIPNLIRNNLRGFNPEKYRLVISPLYKEQEYIYVYLSSIINIKIVHIINMLKMIGGIRNERTSNRRFNANSYGKYKKHDRC